MLLANKTKICASRRRFKTLIQAMVVCQFTEETQAPRLDFAPVQILQPLPARPPEVLNFSANPWAA